MSKRWVLKRMIDERGEGVYADVGNGGVGFGEEEIVEGG